MYDHHCLFLTYSCLQADTYKEDFKRERRDRENLAGQFEEEKCRLSIIIQELRDNVMSVKELLNCEKDNKAAVEVEKANIETKLAKQDKKIKELEELIQGYTDQLTCHDQFYLQIKSKLEEERQSKQELENKAGKLQEQIDLVTAEKLSLQEELHQLESNYKLKEKQLETLSADKSNLDIQLKQRNTCYTASQVELMDCLNQLETAITDKSRVSDEVIALQSKIQDQEVTLTTVT